MRKIAIISGLALLALMLLAFAGALFLLRTAPGHRFIASMIEPRLGAALGGSAKIARLEGNLPGEIRLIGVTLESEGAQWMTIDLVEMVWSPFAVLDRRIDIDRLAISGVAVAELPPQREKKDEPREFRPPSLPLDLPFVSVRDLSINALTVGEAVAGRPLALDAAGNLRMGGPALSLHFSASSASDSDTVNMIVELDPEEDRGVIDILVASEADGAISSLAELGGRSYLEIRADAPPADFKATVIGELGAFGSIDAAISGDLTIANALSADAQLHLGEKLSSIANEIGGDIAVVGGIRSAKGGGVELEIKSLTADAGTLSGRVTWPAPAKSRGPIIASIRAAFAEGYRSEITEWTGANAAIEARARSLRNGLRIEGSLKTPQLTLSTEDARLDEAGRFEGPVSISLSPPSTAPVSFSSPLELNGDLSFDEEMAAFKNFSLHVGQDAEAAGDISYALETKEITGESAFEMTPAFARQLAPQVLPEGVISGRLSVKGRLNNFDASLNTATPRITYNGGSIPAATIRAEATGLPENSAININAKAADNSGSLIANAQRGADGRITVSGLNLKGVSFSLAGSGTLDPAEESLVLDLAYIGAEDAEPWPGVPVAGTVNAKGRLARRGANDLTVEASDVVSGEIRIAQLDATAAGPAGAVRLRAKAQGLLAPAVGVVDDLTVEGTADLDDRTALQLTRLDAMLEDLPVRLSAPVTLRFDDGIAIESLRANVGADGAVNLGGSYSATRWRLKGNARNVPFRGSNSLATLEIALDTDRKVVAEGTLEAKSAFAAKDAPSIGGQFSWDGARVKLVNTDPSDAIEFNIELPLILTREPKLSVELDGTLKGTMRYAGDLEGLTPYLPMSLQGLEGAVEANATVGGTIDNPLVDGRVTIRDAAYTELISGLSLVGLHGEAVASASAGQSTIEFKAGARGPGQTSESIAMEGTVALADEATIDANLTMTGVKLAAGPVDFAIADGSASLAGPLNAMVVKGDIAVSELNAEIEPPPSGGLVDITVVPKSGDAETEPEEDLRQAPPLAFDVSLKAASRVFIRGRGLETEWSAAMRAEGDTERPLLTGALDLRRGFLDFSGRRFTLTRGRIAFDRLSENNPSLDIRAEHETGGVTAAIEIKGRARTPSVSLVSTPSLPSDDIMALVLFGKSANELSAIESLQVAQALAQLGGIGPFGGGGVTGVAREALGLDMLNIDLDADTGASSLEVGKYVAEGLFVSASQDARGEKGSVRVEYEVTKSITIETEVKQDGDQTVSANWKRDF